MAFVWFSPGVEKRPSPVHGLGLFAARPLAPLALVVVKGGHVFDRPTRDRLAGTLGPAEIQIEADLFLGPVDAEGRDAAMMHLNHSCAPNLGIEGQICFRTRRAVDAGEELTLDYATFDDDDYAMDCACGAPACRGRVTGQDWRLASVRAAHAGWFAPHLARRIAQGTSER
ncbi:MAG: SET domain-containing protein [Paracoccaceae bacterium]